MTEWRRFIPRRRYVPPEEQAYRRLAQKGFVPTSIIDVGAYDGRWTRMARRVFGDVPALMIEARPGKLPKLAKASADMAGTKAVIATLAAEAGRKVQFYMMGSASSFFPERSTRGRTVEELTTDTLDNVAKGIEGPFFLKLDVQGAELEVLEGGKETLSKAELVQLEVPFVPYNEGAPTLFEVFDYMRERDFVPFDISGFARPNGIDLAQADFLFTRTDSPLRRKFFEF